MFAEAEEGGGAAGNKRRKAKRDRDPFFGKASTLVQRALYYFSVSAWTGSVHTMQTLTRPVSNVLHGCCRHSVVRCLIHTTHS
jgi:hypothetical protein